MHSTKFANQNTAKFGHDKSILIKIKVFTTWNAYGVGITIIIGILSQCHFDLFNK